ncbi:ROK family transcriptional regulator [Bifidobacterium eulemuris]|uniref:NagC family transcriptional regulator n=1 Tax=Bifidobacterium eulemuris TaxID=1765219 RepID=A0A261FXY3_9BIFI|nr:ROK family transcriptional regulator [Bifidobacterium eulemuris]OZG64017.1 NagC family transcriptional regulator [Bifidobacterium eulemuris]QOL32386.1 ROK family transcriptional regulator [Bifidobacterium eulemuris]
MADENAIPQWFSGSEHTHKVAAAIAKYGPIARTTLAQMLGLSQGALSRITSDLIYAGVIEELPASADGPKGRLPEGFTPKESADRRGRPQTSLALCANARTFVGLKVHGHYAVAAAVNAHGEVVSGRYEETFENQSPDCVTATIAKLVAGCAADVVASGLPSPLAVGVAVGGHVQEDSVVTFAPFLHWTEDIDLGKMVHQATGLPCGVFNDIDSLLVDACWFGPGVGYEMFAVLTIGVGVGYSLAVRGEPVTYPDKSYGLIGHILVDPEGPRCISGHVGCAQCFTDDSIAEQYSAIIGRAASFEDFADDARRGVPQAAQLLNRTCFRLGTLIATIANVAMPGMVMVAGESAFLAKIGIDSIRDGISRHRHNQAAPVKFVVADHDWQLWAKAAASRVIVNHIG